MLEISQKNTILKKGARKNQDVIKARKYLESIHPIHSFLYGERPFHYMGVSQEENCKRYLFYRGHDRQVVFIVLSDEEKCKIESKFRENKGKAYSYRDSIIINNRILHRFCSTSNFNTSVIFMNDDGTIFEGDLPMDLEMCD